MNLLWGLVPIITSLAAVLIGAANTPGSAIPADSELGKHLAAGNRVARLFGLWLGTGYLHMIGWSRKVAIPTVFKPIDSHLRLLIWTIVISSLLIFAGFALQVYWLSQGVAGILLFIMMILFIFLHGKKADNDKAGKEDKGGFWGFTKEVAFQLGQGIGVVAMILVSLVLIQWGIGDLVPWVGYGVWGGYLVGVGVFILTRLLGQSGFTGLTFMFLIAVGCFVVGLATRIFPVETGNLLSQYSLLREEVEQNTAKNNADANQTFAVVKESVFKYELVSKVSAGWSLFSSSDEQKTGTVIVKLKRLSEQVQPGTLRRLDALQYKTKTGTDIFIRVAQPADDGTVLDDDGFYIPLNAKVEVSATEKTAEAKSEPLVVTESSATVSPDGNTCELVVSPTAQKGVSCVDSSGRKLELTATDSVTITATGEVNIGRGKVGPNGESGYRDSSMDSPFSGSVGGLEMWLGDKTSFDDRQFVGNGMSTSGFTGIPTFRVIQSLDGMRYRNPGAFRVVIKKQSTGGT